MSRFNLTSFALSNTLYAGATVSIFLADPVTGAATTTLAPIYLDLNTPRQAPNPQVLDSRGKWLFPIYAASPVIISVQIGTGQVEKTGVIGLDAASTAGLAPIDNPTFTGTPEAPSPALGAVDDEIAVASFVQGRVGGTLQLAISANRSLTADEAGNANFIITGTTPGPTRLLFPDGRSGRWTVSNKTNSDIITQHVTQNGAVVITSGHVQTVFSTGTDFSPAHNDYANTPIVAGNAGRLLAIKRLTLPGTYSYVPTPGTSFIEVEVQAGGAGGGAVPATSSSQYAASGGGSGGGYACATLTYNQIAVASPITITVGAGGDGGTNGTGAGARGGTTSFGSLLSVPGGFGGNASSVYNGTNYTITGYGGLPTQAAVGGGSDRLVIGGSAGGNAFVVSGQASAGFGGDAHLGPGGSTISNNSPGARGLGYGGGGSGAMATGTGAPALNGGPGASGCVIIREYT